MSFVFCRIEYIIVDLFFKFKQFISNSTYMFPLSFVYGNYSLPIFDTASGIYIAVTFMIWLFADNLFFHTFGLQNNNIKIYSYIILYYQKINN